MEVVAISRSVKISPRKVRLVADAVRKTSVQRALTLLALVDKRSASSIEKTINSAVANAIHNAKLDKNLLFIKSIEVAGGPAFKRFRPSTRGRVHPYKKKTSHIKVVLEDMGGNT